MSVTRVDLTEAREDEVRHTLNNETKRVSVVHGQRYWCVKSATVRFLSRLSLSLVEPAIPISP